MKYSKDPLDEVYLIIVLFLICLGLVVLMIIGVLYFTLKGITVWILF